MSPKFEYFGKYILFDKLAMGGMAEVYRGRAPGAEGIGKIVAVKRILPQYSANHEFVEMFKTEAQIAINITHGNVAQIYEFGEEQKQFYLIMEFIDGRNLRQVLSRCTKAHKALTIEQCIFIVAQVANGLDYAHRCINKSTGSSLNIIHRDVSPQNVMISYEGEIKVVDFGIAKAESKIESTKTGTLKGKFGYMSPEQAEGLELDNRTDIFSLGIVLWELLSGERLFVANNEVNTIRKIRECHIPSLRKINPNISDELERITNKALSKDRSLRYQTAGELGRDLSRFLYKVNPEFTAHELSVFLKSLFKDDILEDRKKMNEMNKALNQKNHRNDVTYTINDLTQTETETETNKNPPQGKSSNPVKGLPEISSPSIKRGKDVDLSEKLSPVELNRIPKPNPYNTRVTGSYSMGGRGQTGASGSYSRPGNYTGAWNEKPGLFSSMGSPLFVIFLGLAAYFGYSKPAIRNLFIKPDKVTAENTSRPENVNIVSQSSETPTTGRIFVKSVPMGAQISIDNQDLNQTTPAEISAPLNKKISVALRKDGYLTYVKEFEATKDPEELVATLQRAQFGYINIEVMPAGADIYINGQKLGEKSPIKRYPVPAETPLQIWALNPYSNTQAKSIVVVKRDQTKTIKLYLSRTKQK